MTDPGDPGKSYVMVPRTAHSALLAFALPTTTVVHPGARLIVRWTAPAGCPRVEGELEALVEWAGEAPPTAPLTRVETRIGPGSVGAFAARIEVGRGSLREEHELHSSSCAGATEKALVTIAGLFPGFSGPGVSSASPGLATPGRPPADARRWGPDALRIDAFAGLLFPARVAAAPWAGSLGGALVLAWARGSWRVELGVDGLLAPLRRPSYDLRDELGGRAVTIDVAWRLVGGHLRGCHHLVGERVSLQGCATLEPGALLPRVAEHPRIEAPERSPSGPWLAVGVGPQVRWQVASRLAVVLGGAGAVDLLPRRFRLDIQGAEPVALDAAPRFVLHGSIGCEFSWEAP